METDPRIVIDALVNLAGQEETLAEARSALSRGEKRRRDQRELAAEYAADGDGADHARRRAESGFRARAREIRALEDSLHAKRALLVGLADRRQHRALTEEIAALEQKLGRLETEAYELLDEAEVHSSEADEAKRGEARAADARTEAETELAAARERAAAAEAEASEEIARLVALLPPDVARHVGRLRSRGDRSVVYLRDGACGGCLGLLPRQQAIAVSKGRVLVRCASCSRYVVHRPWR